MLCAGYNAAASQPVMGQRRAFDDPNRERGRAGWIEVGVVSWGPSGCYGLDCYGVYTRVVKLCPVDSGRLADSTSKLCLQGVSQEADHKPTGANVFAK